MDFRSVRMERVKIVMWMRWGMMSAVGTASGKLRKVGRKAVVVGMNNSRFVRWGFSIIHASFVLNISVRDARKMIHSKEMFVRLDMLIPVPYQLVVRGQNICTPPVK